MKIIDYDCKKMAKCCGIVKCTVHCDSRLNKSRRQVCYACSKSPYYCSIPVEGGDLIIDVDKVIFQGETLFEVVIPFTKNEVACLNYITVHTVEEYLKVLRAGRLFEHDFCKISKSAVWEKTKHWFGELTTSSEPIYTWTDAGLSISKKVRFCEEPLIIRIDDLC